MSDGKPAQILQIEPPRELTFQGPFTDVVNANLTLRNPSDARVCFKVKTTAPKQYCVRPNSGVIEAGDSKTVTVMLQPMDGTPADIARHKFMVQSCILPDNKEMDESIWKAVPQAELMYSKLMVVFEQPRPAVASSYGREEAPAAIQFSSPSASAPSRGSSMSGSTRDSNEMNDTIRQEVAEAKRLGENQANLLKKTIEELSKKNAQLQKEMQNGHSEVGVPTLQVILLAIAGLLIGLIVGKLF